MYGYTRTKSNFRITFFAFSPGIAIHHYSHRYRRVFCLSSRQITPLSSRVPGPRRISPSPSTTTPRTSCTSWPLGFLILSWYGKLQYSCQSRWNHFLLQTLKFSIRQSPSVSVRYPPIVCQISSVLLYPEIRQASARHPSVYSSKSIWHPSVVCHMSCVSLS